MANKAIARKLGVSAPTVGTWRSRYLEHGIQGLRDELRPGRPRRISDEKIAALIQKTLNSTPANAPHWSVRWIGGETGISKSSGKTRKTRNSHLFSSLENQEN